MTGIAVFIRQEENNIMTTDLETFAELQIDYDNCIHNYRHFRSKLKPATKLLVLIKANSYGHGGVEFAQIMEEAGADYFAVAHPIEGIEMRKGGIKKPIIILTAGTDYYKEIIEYGLEPGIPDIESLRLFNSTLGELEIKEYPVHIKLDTGMHRLGFMEKELPALLEFLKKKTRIRVQSVYSHLAAADEPRHDRFTMCQIELYKKMASEIDAALDYKPIRHLLNSAGIERFTEYQFDMVRLGIGIYEKGFLNDPDLEFVASLKCKILQIKELEPHDGTVGYGRHGRLHSNGITKIATLPLGYADGINRHLGCGKARFMLNGKLVPTIGNICMDMCMIDITGVEAKVGDTVTIFGENPKVSDLAKILGTIPYEVFTSISRRVKRVVVRGSASLIIGAQRFHLQ